jgi:hypothetical protein
LPFVLIIALVFAACGSDSNGEGEAPGAIPTAAGEQSPAPVVPTPTDVPSIPAGWQGAEGNDFSLAVPPNYSGGNPNEQSTIDAIRALGSQCVAAAGLIVQLVELQPGAARYAGVNTDTCAVGPVRSLLVLAAPVPGETPAEFLAAFTPGLPDTADLLEQREVVIGGEPAAYLRVQRNYATAPSSMQAIYAVRGASAWFLIFGQAALEDFDAALPEYEAIAQTFRAQ